LRFHHVAIETVDLANTVNWYLTFFPGIRLNWEQDQFSSLTHERLPRITKLVELQVSNIRFHFFERIGVTHSHPPRNVTAFQHFCFQVPTPQDLNSYRLRWFDLRYSGIYNFTHDETATDIVVDQNAVASFYFLDVNGLEFEMTYVPEEMRAC